MSKLLKSLQNIVPKSTSSEVVASPSSAVKGGLTARAKEFVEKMKSRIPSAYLYKDIGEGAVLHANVYRTPSPGAPQKIERNFPLQFPEKAERLAKNYYFQRGYYNAAEANKTVVKSNFDEEWRNVSTWSWDSIIKSPRRATLKRSSQLSYIIGDELITVESFEKMLQPKTTK